MLVKRLAVYGSPSTREADVEAKGYMLALRDLGILGEVVMPRKRMDVLNEIGEVVFKGIMGDDPVLLKMLQEFQSSSRTRPYVGVAQVIDPEKARKAAISMKERFSGDKTLEVRIYNLGDPAQIEVFEENPSA